MANKGKYYESQFEEATIELLQDAQWQYTFGDELHRKFTDPLIEEDLRTFLHAQYANKGLTEAGMDNVVANLRNVGGQKTTMPVRMPSCCIVMATTLRIAIIAVHLSVWSILTLNILIVISSVV